MSHSTSAFRRRAAIGAIAVAMVATACGSDAPSTDDAADELGDVDVEVVATDAAAVVDSVVDEVESGTTDLVQALRDNGLDSAAGIVEQIDVDELIADEEFTFFAPNDEAFTTLDADETADLLADPAMILDVLRNHLVTESMTADELAEAGSVDSEAGETLTVSSDGDAVQIGDVVVVTTDIEVGGGVIHVVDGFLLPE
jgi:uncharacterized surface protein with fasciclin (FAS1) repeats